MSQLYKTQATRLVQFLSDQHKFRLKHANSQEAIAAIHGFKDWNTLSASDGNAVAATTMTPATGAVISPDEAFARLFGRDRFSDPLFCDALLSLRIQVTGGSRAEKDAFLDHLLVRQASRGGFLHLSSSRERATKVAAALHRAGRWPNYRAVDPQNPRSSCAVQPLPLNCAPADIADVMLEVLQGHEGLDANRNREQCRHILTEVLLALDAAGLGMKLDTVVTRLLYGADLLSLRDSIPDNRARDRFTTFLKPFVRVGKDGERIDVAEFNAQVGSLRVALGSVSVFPQTAAYSSLFSEADFDFEDMLSNGLGVQMATSTDPTRPPRDALLVLKSLLRTSQARARCGQSHAPFALFIDDSTGTLAPFVDAHVSQFAEEGFGVVLVRHAGPDLSHRPAPLESHQLSASFDVTASIAAGGGFESPSLVSLDTHAGRATTSALSRYSDWPQMRESARSIAFPCNGARENSPFG